MSIDAELLGQFKEFLESRYYTIEEFAALPGVNRAPYTVREKWCNDGRINAAKSMTGAGAFCTWVISHHEYIRFKREGLLPKDPKRNKNAVVRASLN